MMKFGLYLVRHGVITADQFVTALEAHLQSAVPLPQLVIEEGAMPVHDVFEVLQTQTPDESFVDTARRLGRLSDEICNRLRVMQIDRQLPLADFLVRQNALTTEQVHKYWQAFRQEQTRRGPQHREQIPRLHVLRHTVPVLPALSGRTVPRPLARLSARADSSQDSIV